MRTWIPGWTDAMRETDRSLASTVRARIHCTHDLDSEVLHLRKLHDLPRDYPRALRFRCRKCPRDLFIKRFGEDCDVSEQRRELRLDVERRNLELLWRKQLFCERFSAPRLFSYAGSPHFALVEEFFGDDELLVLFKHVAGNNSKDADMFSALAATARFVVSLHEAPITRRDRCVLQKRFVSSQLGSILREVRVIEKYTDQLQRLALLQEAWVNDALLLRATKGVSLIHGGLTCVNLLFSGEGCLRVIDFETLCLGTRYIDVGTFTAEIKTAFQLHAGNSFLAEPYIGFFLKEYYAHSNIGLTYPEFTRLQAYFMGQRLLFMSAGRSFDDGMRRWLAQTALDGV